MHSQVKMHVWVLLLLIKPKISNSAQQWSQAFGDFSKLVIMYAFSHSASQTILLLYHLCVDFVPACLFCDDSCERD
jgi:hypothetical protein